MIILSIDWSGHPTPNRRRQCYPIMIRLLSCQTWSGVEFHTLLQFYANLYACEIHKRIGATGVCSYSYRYTKTWYTGIFTNHLSVSLSFSLSHTLSLSLSLSLFIEYVNRNCSNDLLIRSNGSFTCLNDLLIRPNESFVCLNDSVIRPNESFIFSNKSFTCSNDLLIRPNESFICSTY